MTPRSSVWPALLLLATALLAALLSAPALGATLTVTRTDDPVPDGCVTNGCTLREAMLEAQEGDTIAFGIAGAGTHVIQPTSELPNLGGNITIDGYTQAGALQNTNAAWQAGNAQLRVVLDGSLIPPGQEASGILISGRNVRVKGLVIQNFAQEGIYVSAFGTAVIQGNYIGTNAPGTAAAGNGTSGIWVNSDHTGNVIGGSAPENRNVISGNAGAGLLVTGAGTISVAGNFIGTDAAGAAALGNGGPGVDMEGHPGSTVGGSTEGAGNLISGNGAEGLLVAVGARNLNVFGNRIGSDADGRAALANGGSGVVVRTSGVNIGATVAGAGNLISGNAVDGLVIAGPDASGLNAKGNTIGAQINRLSALPNGRHGVFLDDGADNDTIGGEAEEAQNVISFNGAAGVALSPSASVNNYIDPNVMQSNGMLGIDLGDDGLTPNDDDDTDGGPNDLQNYPLLTSAKGGVTTVLSGTLNSTPNRAFNLFFFSNTDCDPSGYGEGRTFLAQAVVITNGDGDGSFTRTLPVAVPPGQFITTTASNPESTSEYSPCIEVSAPSIEHGDLRCTGHAGAAGAAALLQALAGVARAVAGCPTLLSPVEAGAVTVWGDIDCDGIAGLADVRKLLRWKAGLPVVLGQVCPAIGDLISVRESLRGGVLATFQVIDEQFDVWVTNAATIQQLFDVQSGASTANIPVGRILPGPGQAAHNAPWSWHLDPQEIEMAEVAIEVCDARPSYVEENVGYFVETLGSYCPWPAQLVSLTDYR